MLSCHDIFDKASAFHDEDLPLEEHGAYRQHLEMCVQCEKFYRGFETTIHRARQALVVEVPPGLEEELVHRVRERLSKSA